MAYFLPFIAPIDGGESGSALRVLLLINVQLNIIPCTLTALALWWTARWHGIRHSWLALIPLADLWVLGSLSDRYQKIFREKEKRMRKILPLLGGGALGSTLLAIVAMRNLPQTDSPLGIAGVMVMALLFMYGSFAVWGMFIVNRIIALSDLYTGYSRGHPGLYIVLSVLCPPLIPFFICRCRW